MLDAELGDDRVGELSDEELRSFGSRIRPGRTALRYFDQLEFDAS